MYSKKQIVFTNSSLLKLTEMTNTEYQIQTIIESIDDMQKVINAARRDFEGLDTVEDCSYPFAAGYTSAGLSNIKYSLCQLLN